MATPPPQTQPTSAKPVTYTPEPMNLAPGPLLDRANFLLTIATQIIAEAKKPGSANVIPQLVSSIRDVLALEIEIGKLMNQKPQKGGTEISKDHKAKLGPLLDRVKSTRDKLVGHYQTHAKAAGSSYVTAKTYNQGQRTFAINGELSHWFKQDGANSFTEKYLSLTNAATQVKKANEQDKKTVLEGIDKQLSKLYDKIIARISLLKSKLIKESKLPKSEVSRIKEEIDSLKLLELYLEKI